MKIKVDTIANDDRGLLLRLFEDVNFSVVYATSKTGSIRANHYHQTGSHYCYITKGRGRYFFRPANSIEDPQVQDFYKGDMIFTPPMVEHKFVFTEDSEFITISPHSREQQHYEEDLIRVNI